MNLISKRSALESDDVCSKPTVQTISVGLRYYYIACALPRVPRGRMPCRDLANSPVLRSTSFWLY